MAVIDYPHVLPCPALEPFGADATAGLIRTEFEAGNTKQRRRHSVLPHLFSARWIMSQPDYGQWLAWMNKHGWDWFNLNLPSAYAGLQGKDTVPHRVRLASDIASSLVPVRTGYYWEIRANLEWLDAGSLVVLHSVGSTTRSGTPSTATAITDWIIARTPSHPSTGGPLIGGTPHNPSA